MWESGQALSSRFVLIERLGEGGGGEVWSAEDRERGERVALKILWAALARNDAAIAALERECARVRSLDHPNILRVDGVYRAAYGVWLAMEYAAGGDLRHTRGRGVAEIVRKVHPIAAALAYAHGAGLVHRDVKPANVLLSDEGAPKLADFGMALEPAAFAAADAGRGSLYTMSPQQRDGEAAHASDDVYGLGALLYELLQGYPPFYPDASRERIRHEQSPLPRSTPAWLMQLVMHMLAKRRDERPDMRAVERELAIKLAMKPEGAFEEAPLSNMSNEATLHHQEPVRIEPPSVRPPSVHGEPLRGEWRRGADAASDPHARRRTIKRVLGAAGIASALAGLAVVFLLLPRVVEQTEPARYVHAASTVAPETPVEKEEVDFAALARAKQEADERRAPLAERLQKLTERAAHRWGAVDYQAATEKLAAGDAAYEQREYVAALEQLAAVEPLLIALEQRAGAALKEQLQAGAEALAAGRSADAKAAFELAAKIEPANAIAAQGLKRAATLDEVLSLVASAVELEQSGDMNGAIANFRKALALDAQAPRAADGVARIEARLAGDAFASAMARGYAALASANYTAARTQFEAAREIRPQAPEIAQALRQIDQEQRTGVIATRLEQAQVHESAERWAEALKNYRDVLELDSTVAAASEGVARTTPRASLNEQLELYLTQPERLFSQPVRAAARDTLARAGAIASPGPLLEKQTATLADWVARADVPVPIAIESDNVTQVTIYRVGDLGVFGQRSLELVPGSYTVVGTRPGYRDVRRQINVTPGAPLEPIVIRCEDRI